jgi:hypothetical protein
MHGIVFDIGLGAGLAAACGLRPFLPLLLAGALGSSSALDVSFNVHRFVFVQETLWLLVVSGALVVAYAVQLLLAPSGPAVGRGENDSRASVWAATQAGLAYGSGALLFAGALAAHHNAWWPGAIAGLGAAWLADAVAGPVLAGARARLSDRAAREALTVYLDAASLLAAVLVCVLHPLGYVLVAVLAWFLLRVRARGREKYAGLRILRR